jgi:hypothetical protein
MRIEVFCRSESRRAYEEMPQEDRQLLSALLVALVVVAIEIPLAIYAPEANWLGAWSNFGILLATLALVTFTRQQLVGISRTQREAKNDQRKWATLQACDRYDSDPFIQNAVEKLTLVNPAMDDKARDLYVTRLLNYFSSIAIGLDQDFYDDTIARAHIGYLVVHWFDYIVSKPDWYSAEATRRDFPDLARLVDRWTPDVAGRSQVGSAPSSLPRQ